MDPRYTHPAIGALWSREWTYSAWTAVLARVADRQASSKIIDVEETAGMIRQLRDAPPIFDQKTIEQINEIEEDTRHDVVAYLTWLRGYVGESGRWLHYGLTSSDLVDTAQAMRFREARLLVTDRLGNLMHALTKWIESDAPVIGRTHGQVAEPMTMKARAWAWSTNLAAASTALIRACKGMEVAKLSGPVGTYAHNPPHIEVEVALDLHLRPHGPGATQIASRVPLAAWASAAATFVEACAKIAMDIRLMNLTGEAIIQPYPGQVGSSSMAHKINPIREEQLAGMARLAHGYASMLQSLDLWLERDISNSCVERIAVPDLWHVVMHAIRETTAALNRLKINEVQVAQNLMDAGVKPLVSQITLVGIKNGMSVGEAREWALNRHWMVAPESARVFMENYPDTRTARR